MNTLGSENNHFVWLLRIDAAIATLLLILLLVSLLSRHFLLPQRAYLGGALLGFLAWLAFIGASGETFVTIQPVPIFRLPLFVGWLPYFLLVEVAVLCWLGAHKPWRELLLGVVLASALLMRFPEVLGGLLRR